jgi:Ca2+-binding EF-hand superfamily protein
MMDCPTLIGKNVKNEILAAALMTSVAFSVHAMSAEIDTDGDGKASFAELQVSYPELTEEVFGEIDSNSDGLVDDEEMAIAVELGNLADPEIDA